MILSMNKKNILFKNFIKTVIILLFTTNIALIPCAAQNEKPEKKEIIMTVKAYAYCLYSRTSTGKIPSRGTIAVDPKKIPYGAKIYIPGYGWGTALDRGSAIKGNKIDVWFPTLRECINWGIRTVKIKVYL